MAASIEDVTLSGSITCEYIDPETFWAFRRHAPKSPSPAIHAADHAISLSPLAGSSAWRATDERRTLRYRRGDARSGGGIVTIRVLLVDDEHMVREGFRLILETQPDIRVVGEADDGITAIDAAMRLTPDVVLMDIRMRGMDGLEATRKILTRTAQPPKVVMLTTFDYDEY